MTAPAEKPPVAIRPATTLLLLRDGAAGLEVLMVTRNVASEFASGALVFPGGRVDAADHEAVTHRCCREVAGVDAAGLALRVAGIRETFEEAAILLARPAGGNDLLSAGQMAAFAGQDFAAIVGGGAVELATDLLVPFAHWITPAGQPKRYDTHFYLAPMPPAQTAAHDGHEAVDTTWITPAEAIAGGETGRYTVVFATRLNLQKLGRSADMATALATARWEKIVTVAPEVLQGPNGRIMRIPIEAGYGVSEVDAQNIPRA